MQIVKIFNLFITYGDTFLPNPSTYDELYYELIRMQKVFEDIHAMGKEHTAQLIISPWYQSTMYTMHILGWRMHVYSSYSGFVCPSL